MTVAELAAFLGVTPGRIRQIIAEHDIVSAGHRWKAKLYHATDVLRHTGMDDRRLTSGS